MTVLRSASGATPSEPATAELRGRVTTPAERGGPTGRQPCGCYYDEDGWHIWACAPSHGNQERDTGYDT